MPILHSLATLGLLHLFITLFFGFLVLCFFARVILSWLSMVIPSLSPGNPFVRFFDNITDPLYLPIYRRLPPSSMGAFDMRGIIAFLFAWWGLGVLSFMIAFALPSGW